MLVARTSAGPAAAGATTVAAFQSAFIVIVVLAGLGVILASIAFPRVPSDARVRSAEEVVVAEAGSPG